MSLVVTKILNTSKLSISRYFRGGKADLFHSDNKSENQRNLRLTLIVEVSVRIIDIRKTKQ